MTFIIMIKLSHKDSEHNDLYSLGKVKPTEDDEAEQESSDELYKFKRSVSLNPAYEVYIETEKLYQKGK